MFGDNGEDAAIWALTELIDHEPQPNIRFPDISCGSPTAGFRRPTKSH
jgi:hypothetical protein